MRRFADCGLYVVITEAFCNGRAASDVLRACVDGGVRLVQLREKNLDARDLFRRAEEFRRITADTNTLLIIDDRADIALAVGADGVHLGQSDLPIAAARAFASDLILGASSHDLQEALTAQEAGASYVNIGPIFATQTKHVATGVIGPEAVTAIAPSLHIPFTCMGGLKQHNIHEILRRGARHIAVVTAVTAAADPAQAARDLIREIAAASPPVQS